MRRYLLVISLLMLLLPSCRSHKATVVRPAANAEFRQPARGKSAGKSDQKVKVKTDGGTTDVDPRMGSELVSAVRRWLGTPYRYGGETKSGTDCSGMVMVVYHDVAGLKLPRSSAEQAEYCIAVPRRSLQPGDLVFFSSSRGGNRISHVGMYVGDGKMIHASSSRGVIESDLAEKYYDAHYHSSGRVYGVTLEATGGKKNARKETERVVKKDSDKEAEKRLAPQTSAPAPSPVPVGKKVVKEVSLDEFVASQGAAQASQSPAQSSVQSAPQTVSATDSTKVAVKGPVVIIDGVRKEVAPQQVSGTVPADSARRADEIRRDVTKAMRFGK